MARKILIYSIGSVGDTLVSIPGIRVVREHFGEDNEYYLFGFKDSSLPFAFEHSFLMKLGLVKDVIYYEKSKNFISALYNLFNQILILRKNKFSLVVNLATSNRNKFQIFRDKLFFCFSGIRSKIGFLCFPNKYQYPFTTSRRSGLVMREAQSKIIRLAFDGVVSRSKLEDLGSIRSKVDALDSNDVAQWQSHFLFSGSKYVAIGPGTKMPAKSWPEERFLNLGNKILERGFFKLVVVGAKFDFPIAKRLVEQWGEENSLNACGQFDLIGTSKIISKCLMYIGVDSGLAHLAGALEVENVVISSDHWFPGQWDVLSHKLSLNVRHQVDCGGCGLSVCNKHDHPCMKNITVEQVFEKYLQLEKFVLTSTKNKII